MLNSIIFDNNRVVPNKIVCIGRNYVEHIKELGNEIPSAMVIFNKPNSAISQELKFFYDDTRFECEICFLIKDKSIKGVGIGLDLTHASIQNNLKAKGLPWERAKSFDSSAVFSDFILFDDDISNLSMKLYINNKLVQYASYDLMIYKPYIMIEEILSFMTLEDYDIIMSGTPKGVGNYKVGDVFRGELFFKDTKILAKEWIVS